MTAKEEAKELFDKYNSILMNEISCEYARKYAAILCALIAVEFAAEQFEKYCLSEIGLHWTKDDERTDGSYDHFRYLKEELQKL
jgi:hypothetical protein